MFSCVVAGRPVNTELQTISPTQYAFSIPSQPSFSHIVVFLLPNNTLNPGSAAGVYIQIPPSQDFKLLGAVANDKQSAVFKVNTGPKQNGAASSTAYGDDVMTDEATALPVGEGPSLGGPNIVLGISIEPADSIRSQLAALKSQGADSSGGSALVRHQPQQSRVATKVLAQRIIENAFNFLSGFATGSSGNETVPLRSFRDWWTKFEKRIELDPSFLERQEQT